MGKGNGIIKDAMRKHSDALSIIEFLTLPKEDLLAYEFHTGEVFRPSYFIALDRATNSIVLSIRGTMSAVDTLTDLACEYQQWRGGLVHSGMKVSTIISVIFSILMASILEVSAMVLYECGSTARCLLQPA